MSSGPHGPADGGNSAPHASPTAPGAPPDVARRVPRLMDLAVDAVVDTLLEHRVTSIEPMLLRLPEDLADRVLAGLRARHKLTDHTLGLFFTSFRWRLVLRGASNIRKSVLRQIAFRCPSLRVLDLSDCKQVNNVVVRAVLQHCHSLHALAISGCRHVTDTAFQPEQSPFVALRACLSLEALNFDRCPQISDGVIELLAKASPNLRSLSFAHCKSISSRAVRHAVRYFDGLQVVNVAFATKVGDDVLPQLRSEPTVLPSPPPTPDHYWRARDAAVRERQTRVRALRAAAAPAGEGEGSEAAAPGEQQEEEEQQPAALEGGITAVAASVLAPSGDEVPAEAATEAAAAAGADVLGDPLTGSLPSPPDARADAQPAAERAFAPTPQRAASVAGAGSPGAPSVRPVAGEAVAAAGAAEHGGAFRRQGQHEASPWAHPAGTDSGDDGERPPVPSLPSGLSLPHGGYGSDDHAAEARLLPPRGSSMVFASSLDVEGVSVIAYSLGSGPASPGRSAAGEHSALSTSLAGAGAGAGAGGDVAAQWLFKPVAGTAERRAAGADPPHPTAAADVAVPGAGEALPAAQGGGSSAPNTPQRRRRTSRAGAREAASGAEAGGRTVSGGPCSLPAQSLHAAAAAAVPQQSVTRWGPSTPQPAAVAAAISCDGGDAVPRPVGSSASDGSGDGGYVGQGGQEVAPVPRFLAQPIRPWAASLSNGLSLREINLTGCSVTNRLLLRIGALCPNLRRIHLGFCIGVTSRGLAEVVRGCPHLADLDLRGCGTLGPAAATQLADCASLRRVNLSWCTGLPGHAIVAAAGGWPELEELSVANVHGVVDADVQHIARRHSNLRTLIVEGCANVSSQTRAWLENRGIGTSGPRRARRPRTATANR